MIQEFLDMCDEPGVPIALDKTEWATINIVFLGILLDGKNMTLVIPEEKRIWAVNMLQTLSGRSKSKATVKELQTLCGYLNFLNKVQLCLDVPLQDECMLNSVRLLTSAQ